MLVKQVRKRETWRHASHSQLFNSLDWFGKSKGHGKKINTLSVYSVLWEREREINRYYTVLRLCIHSALMIHIMLAFYFVHVCQYSTFNNSRVTLNINSNSSTFKLVHRGGSCSHFHTSPCWDTFIGLCDRCSDAGSQSPRGHGQMGPVVPHRRSSLHTYQTQTFANESQLDIMLMEKLQLWLVVYFQIPHIRCSPMTSNEKWSNRHKHAVFLKDLLQFLQVQVNQHTVYQYSVLMMQQKHNGVSQWWNNPHFCNSVLLLIIKPFVVPYG